MAPPDKERPGAPPQRPGQKKLVISSYQSSNDQPETPLVESYPFEPELLPKLIEALHKAEAVARDQLRPVSARRCVTKPKDRTGAERQRRHRAKLKAQPDAVTGARHG